MFSAIRRLKQRLQRKNKPAPTPLSASIWAERHRPLSSSPASPFIDPLHPVNPNGLYAQAIASIQAAEPSHCSSSHSSHRSDHNHSDSGSSWGGDSCSSSSSDSSSSSSSSFD